MLGRGCQKGLPGKSSGGVFVAADALELRGHGPRGGQGAAWLHRKDLEGARNQLSRALGDRGVQNRKEKELGTSEERRPGEKL